MTHAIGVVRFGPGEGVAPGEKLVGRGWLELEDEARVVVTHSKTAREWSLEGPALAAFCPRGREQVILASGKLGTEPGPGGEVTVGTPFGTVAYTDARFTLRVSSNALRLSILAGGAWLTPSGPKPLPDVRASKGSELRRTKRPTAADAITVCSDARHRGVSLEPARPNEAIRGRRRAPDPEFLRAVKWSGASCASAGAAALSELRGQEREYQLRRLTGLEQRWRRVPPGVEILR